MARRARQHVNPLSRKYVLPRAEALRRPGHLAPDCQVDVELGCADGDFSFALAAFDPSRWVVGLEIREKLVEGNRRRVEALGQTNLSFAYVNLNVDLDRVFSEQSVDRFHLLFPDPWFKSKHQKRRVLDLGLATTIRAQLKPGGELHIASDVFELGLDMMDAMEHPDVRALGFANVLEPWSFWRGNPFPAASRREQTTLARGQRVWRARYRLV